MDKKYNIFFAPLQGYTEDMYRRVHHDVWGGVEQYFTPFIRLEHGEVRSKDLRDILPEHNDGVPVVPQLIANGGDEMRRVLKVIKDMGYSRIDVNMGCPFPLQTKHGRGAALLCNPTAMREILDVMQSEPDVLFSAKMRLGMESADEWRDVISIINDMPLTQLTVHPRVARQQYKGEVNMAAFEELLSSTRHPVIYNGDVLTLDDIHTLQTRFGDSIHGVMIGRGLLAQPWLAMEYASDKPLTPAERIDSLHAMHRQMLQHWERIIPGEAQRLQKLRTVWDYMENTLGHKQWKKLMKAGNMKNYLNAVDAIG